MAELSFIETQSETDSRDAGAMSGGKTIRSYGRRDGASRETADDGAIVDVIIGDERSEEEEGVDEGGRERWPRKR